MFQRIMKWEKKRIRGWWIYDDGIRFISGINLENYTIGSFFLQAVAVCLRTDSQLPMRVFRTFSFERRSV